MNFLSKYKHRKNYLTIEFAFMTYAHKIIHINNIFKVNNIFGFYFSLRLSEIIAPFYIMYMNRVYIYVASIQSRCKQYSNHHLLLPHNVSN